MIFKNVIIVMFLTTAIFLDKVKSMTIEPNKQTKHCDIIEDAVMDLVSRRVVALEKDLSLLKEQLVNQVLINSNLEQKINGLYEQIATDAQHIFKTGTTEEANNEESLFNSTKYKADFISDHDEHYRVKRQANDHIAFSAYVDHDVRAMAKDQIVQFQNVVLNDGNGFNKFTGVFTVPKSGVYMLTFFVETEHVFESVYHIVVNRNVMTSAVADPLPGGEDVQGGNVVLVHLNAGESVWVSVGDAGDNIEGNDLLRTSTFSGYLVYS